MPAADLRPLSLGEILDRTFTLYRRHFLLFLGISAIPQLLILAMNLVQTLFLTVPHATSRPAGGQIPRGTSNGLLAFGVVGFLVAIVIYMLAYLFAQGGTIYAVSDLYLGKSTTIGASLRRMWGQLANLFGVTFLNGCVILIGTIFLIIPGIYLACRLITCVPAALLEDLGARESLERSFDLTKDNAGRAFVIYFLFLAMLYAVNLLFMIPFGVALAFTAKDPSLVRVALVLMQIGTFLATILVNPFFLIATSVFYYDLRVRKEGFDLQLMLNSTGVVPSAGSGVPSMLS